MPYIEPLISGLVRNADSNGRDPCIGCAVNPSGEKFRNRSDGSKDTLLYQFADEDY
jgi:hypothetical protein